jgi:M6 family metalloprotease-like protein
MAAAMLAQPVRWQGVVLSWALLAYAPSIRAADIAGWLEVQWGDPQPNAPPGASSAVQRITLVDGRGTRWPLAAADVSGAVGDSAALSGRFVRASVRYGIEQSLGLNDRPLHVDAIAAHVGHGTSVSGATPWASLLCRYADNPREPLSVAQVAARFDDVPGSLRHYWERMSARHVSLAGSVAVGWFTLPRPRAAYLVTGSIDLTSLMRDCTAAATGTVDFQQFDGINVLVNDDLDGRFWGGSYCGVLDGASRCWRATWTVAQPWFGLAGLAHEMGHGYGLPHANNSDGDASPYDSPWDVMSDPWGYTLTHPSFGLLPRALSGWSRDLLGWIAPERRRVIDRDGVHTGLVIDTVKQSVIVVTSPSWPARAIIIEARRRDALYGARLPGNGVVIHTIDRLRGEPAWSADSHLPPADYADTDGSWFDVGERWRSPDGVVDVSVDAETQTGYRVTVSRGDQRLHLDGFD